MTKPMESNYTDQEIMNFDDGFSLMYAFLAKRIIEAFGEEGESAVRKGLRKYGEDRADVLRKNHEGANLKINMLNFYSIGHDLPPDPRFRRELFALNKEERISHTLVCPMADIWKRYNMRHLGRIYCEEFHRACYQRYGFGYAKVNLAKTLTQEWDEYCAFHVVLRPELLPDELKCQCLEEYDKDYEGQKYDLPAAEGKSGFASLYIRLYYYIANEALAAFGKAAEPVIASAVRDMAEDAADRLKQSAAEQNARVSKDFVDRNYPIAMDPDQEEMWERYGRDKLKGLFVENMYATLYEKLGI